MSAALERRARLVRSRAAVRAWEYRQRGHAKGVWFRLRRALADAAEVYAVPPDEAERLGAEGFAPEAVGGELVPAKLVVFAPRERVAAIAARRQLRPALSPELLAARAIVLVRFPAR